MAPKLALSCASSARRLERTAGFSAFTSTSSKKRSTGACSAERRASVDSLARAYLNQGVTFDVGGEERPFPLDIVPRVIDDATWQRYWDVNVMSGIRLSRHYLKGMQARGWGRVLFLASDSAVVIPEEMVHYGVTKTALLGVARGFAKAVKNSGVTVNSVIAGPTHTEGVEDFVRELVGDDLPWDEAQQRFVAEHRPNSLLGRLIEPEEIANLVAYLSSPLASATTGGALRVDGGYVDHILP